MGLFDFDRDVVAVEEVDKPQSSAQMIKRAHEEFGAPSSLTPEDCFLRLLMKQSEKNVEQVLFGKQGQDKN